ncbi:MAG TPA: GNAT family protein [Chitinophagales bacterium]|nr:GNAT family protein [Chitinophagales bacterium]
MMELSKTYKIVTERLIIRCYEPCDASKFKQAIDSSIAHLLPWMPWAKDEPEDISVKVKRLRLYRGQFDLGIDYTFGIFDKNEKVLIGSTGLHTRLGINAREIGYWIAYDYINKGFATESTMALTKVGFELEYLEKIEIHCSVDNLKSQNIPRKIGYKLEKKLKMDILVQDDAVVSKMIWTMHKEDYENSELKNFELKAFDNCGNRLI